MAIKTFSVELQRADTEKDVLKNDARLVIFDENVNNFLSAHPAFKKTEVLQSSGSTEIYPFTRITVILSDK